MPPLFDLAPGGVCHAAAVTSSAVRSYRTLLTLLRRSDSGLLSVALSLTPEQVWGRRTLSGTVPRWSPDFPLVHAEAKTSSCPTLWRFSLYQARLHIPTTSSTRWRGFRRRQSRRYFQGESDVGRRLPLPGLPGGPGKAAQAEAGYRGPDGNGLPSFKSSN